MTRRPRGEGQIESLPSGRFRARIKVNGIRRTLGVFDTREEADEVLDAARGMILAGEARESRALTLRVWIDRWLTTQARRRARSIDAWTGAANNILRAPFADRPLAQVDSASIRAWILDFAAMPLATTGNPPAHSTAMLALSTLRRILQDAMDEGRVAANPCRDIRIPKEVVTREPWTYLTPDEQRRLLSADSIPLHDRLTIGFSLGTGIRSGEQWSLRLSDVHVDSANPHITIRYGKIPDGPTKSGRIRRVDLFGIGLDAARRWLDILPRYATENPHGLMFPAQGGGFRKREHPLGRKQIENKKFDRFRLYIDSVLGPDRAVRWHDLRHTCASSLIAGWWGREWSLLEVRDHLGHASARQTERYAHLAESARSKAARSTHGLALNPRKAHGGESASSEDVSALPEARGRCVSPAENEDVSASSWASQGTDPGAILAAIASGTYPAADAEALARSVLQSDRTTAAALRVLEGGEHAPDAAAELCSALIRTATSRRGAK